MNPRIAALVVLAAISPLTAHAQPRTYRNMGPFRSEVRVFGNYFDNFFQAHDRADYQSRTAAGVELRHAYRRPGTLTDYYVQENYTSWFGKSLVGSYGGRIGVNRESELQTFNVFANLAKNRPSFEIGNTYARADTTMYGAEYSYRVTPNWQLGVEGSKDRQKYSEDRRRDNRYTGYGGSVRYRGWGSTFSPRVGFEKGKRTVNDTAETYNEDDYYVDVTTEALRPFWINVGYHSRGKNYLVDDPIARNFLREDTGPQVTFTAAQRVTPRMTWSLYVAHDATSSTLRDTSFNTNMVVLSLSFGL